MKTKIWIYIIAVIIILGAIVYFASRPKHQLTNSDLPATPLNEIIPTSTPDGTQATTSSPAQFVPPLSLSVYNDPQYKYKLLYSSDFKLSTAPNINYSADCEQGARNCFALN